MITNGEYLILHLLLGETHLPNLRIRTCLSLFCIGTFVLFLSFLVFRDQPTLLMH